MKEVILIRHGESLYNKRLTNNLDSPMTETGERQIKSVANWLNSKISDPHLWQGISSPYLRCLQSSKSIYKTTSIEFVVSEGPREVMIAYDKTEIPSRHNSYPQFGWSDIPNEGIVYSRENLNEYVERLRDFISGLRDGKYIILSHGMPVETMFDLTIGKFLYNYDIENVKIQNASITWVKDEEVEFFNEIIY